MAWWRVGKAPQCTPRRAPVNEPSHATRTTERFASVGALAAVAVLGVDDLERGWRNLTHLAEAIGLDALRELCRRWAASCRAAPIRTWR